MLTSKPICIWFGRDLIKVADEENIQPVIINMREEIIGIEALNNNTLQSIGVVSGRVALRYVYFLSFIVVSGSQSKLDCYTLGTNDKHAG